MKRALYLDGAAAPLTVQADGPALRIRREGSADGRAPLRLISRIIVRGRVVWQTEALVACMDADVPVAFVTADGSVRGWCLGPGGREDDINALLEDCTLRRDWPGRYQDWLRAMERRSMIHTLPHGQPVPQGLRPCDLWAAREARLDRLRAPVETPVIIGTLTGALEAHLVELFRRSGVDARFVVGHGTPVRLLEGFRRVLAWELWPVAERAALYFCRHGWRQAQRNDARRRLIRQYEAMDAHVEKRFRDLFWRLHRHLQEFMV
jgi:hypothetical protein